MVEAKFTYSLDDIKWVDSLSSMIRNISYDGMTYDTNNNVLNAIITTQTPQTLQTQTTAISPIQTYIESNSVEYTLDTVHTLNTTNTIKIERKIEVGILKNIKSSDDYLLKKNHDCVICLDGFKIGNCNRILPCNHVFHKKCIDKWLIQQKNEGKNLLCPLCQRDLEILF